MGEDDAFDVRATLDALHEGFQVLSHDFRYLFLNDAVVKQARKTREELLGRTMPECFPGIDSTPLYEMLIRCMKERSACDFENEFVHADGAREWFELRIRPCGEGLSILSLDITKRKTLETTLRQAQKMDAIGKLSAGVAHDFNNLLTVIGSFAKFLDGDLPEGSQQKADVKEIQAATDRAAKLTRQLLSFSRQQPMRPGPVAMNDLVTNLQPMLARLLGSKVKVETRLVPRLSTVTADANAIEQVLVNLAVNARDAMPEGGTITFETREAEVGETFAEARGNVLTPGTYVVTSVSDTGAGMTRQVQERIFEPFFTTKAEGRGTGLGLATSYGIVRQAGGFIWVYSEVGRGSTFKVYLPRATGAAAEAPAPAPAIATTGNETVLAVDDDTVLLEVVRRTLLKAGYRVLIATSAEEALAIATQQGSELHLLLTDVILPGPSGPDLSLSLLFRWPAIRIIYTSGFTEASLAKLSLTPGRSVLEKPFTPDDLLRAVRSALT